MDSSMLRQLWLVIEETQSNNLLRLDDDALVQQLLDRLDDRKPLTREESRSISNYLQSRTPLIRDLATARLA